mmetsp:Transcript_22867/g.32215  ORF Transcript_22867/g.32215 Transcript_22867/m.32215 type:complete len:241 (-) Transcript_22867:369-1091(-)
MKIRNPKQTRAVSSPAQSIENFDVLWLLWRDGRRSFDHSRRKAQPLGSQCGAARGLSGRVLVTNLHLIIQLEDRFIKLTLAAGPYGSLESHPVGVDALHTHLIPEIQGFLWLVGFLQAIHQAAVGHRCGLNTFLLHDLQVLGSLLQLTSRDHRRNGNCVSTDIQLVPICSHLFHDFQDQLPLPRVLQGAESCVHDFDRRPDAIIPDLLNDANSLFPLVALPVHHDLLGVLCELAVLELFI